MMEKQLNTILKNKQLLNKSPLNLLTLKHILFLNTFLGRTKELITKIIDYIPENWLVTEFSPNKHRSIYDTITLFSIHDYINPKKLILPITIMNQEKNPEFPSLILSKGAVSYDRLRIYLKSKHDVFALEKNKLNNLLRFYANKWNFCSKQILIELQYYKTHRFWNKKLKYWKKSFRKKRIIRLSKKKLKRAFLKFRGARKKSKLDFV